jgi:hypothetical protein
MAGMFFPCGVLKWRVEEEKKKKSNKNQNFNLLALKWQQETLSLAMC